MNYYVRLQETHPVVKNHTSIMLLVYNFVRKLKTCYKKLLKSVQFLSIIKEKQMALEAKSRYSSFKESETQKKDENICNLSKLAVKV